MPRDYKHAANSGGKPTPQGRRAPAKNPPGSANTGLWGFLFGAVIGVLATALLLPRPAATDCPTLTAPAPADCPGPREIKVPTLVEPEYDFYHLLPKLEVVVPPQETQTRAPAPKAAPAPRPQTPANTRAETTAPPPVETANNHTYLVQAGSFRTAADADRQRARLALLGFQSEIQAAAIDADTTWHRVRIGPYRDPAKLAAVRERLAGQGIDTLLIRVN